MSKTYRLPDGSTSTVEDDSIGKNLRGIRNARQMTQRQVAARMSEISGDRAYVIQEISDYERDIKAPGTRALTLFCRALECSADDVLGLTSSPTRYEPRSMVADVEWPAKYSVDDDRVLKLLARTFPEHEVLRHGETASDTFYTFWQGPELQMVSSNSPLPATLQIHRVGNLRADVARTAYADRCAELWERLR